MRLSRFEHQALLEQAQTAMVCMCKACTPSDLAKIKVLDEVDAILNHLEINVYKALNPQKAEDFIKLESKYAKLLRMAYKASNKEELKALKDAIRSVDPANPSTIDEFVKASAEILEKLPKNASKEVGPVLSDAITDMYKISRRTKMVEMFDKKILSSTSELSPFGTRDKQVVSMMTRNNKIFVNEGIEVMSDNFNMKAKTILENGLKEGWTRKEIASQLKAASDLTVDNDKYWDIVSNNYTNRSRNWANLELYREAGFEEYQILAVGDERTCPICYDLNGKTFSVETQIGILEKASQADDMGEYTSRLPWLSSRKGEDGKIEVGIKQKSGFKTILSDGKFSGSSAKLQMSGFAMPPFHGLCRCTVIEV